jgi:hypothetical protein
MGEDRTLPIRRALMAVVALPRSLASRVGRTERQSVFRQETAHMACRALSTQAAMVHLSNRPVCRAGVTGIAGRCGAQQLDVLSTIHIRALRCVFLAMAC